MFFVYTIICLTVLIPLFALLLWAGTLVLSTLEFSWLFVLIIAGIISVIMGISGAND